MSRIEIELPFSGFYESWHDQKLDYAIESGYQDDHGDLQPGYDEAIWNADIDWQALREEYCKDYVSRLADELELDLEYSGLWSPKYYNFSTDRLFVTIPAEQAQRIREQVQKQPNYAPGIRERFTSYDGFLSNYEPDVTHEDWTRPELDACQWMVLIKLWHDHNHEEDPYNIPEWNDLEMRVIEDIEPWSYESLHNAYKLVDAEYKKLQEKK